MTEPVLYDVAAGVATITLNRPDAMNSLDTATKEALLGAVQRAADDDSARAVVITGSGRAFCVGQDLREHITHITTKPPEEVWETVDRHYSPIALGIATMDKPVIAAVNGIAAGAGMSIAMVCDLRIAAETAGFNTAFTGVALSCDTGSSWTLPRLVGRSVALDLLLRPRTLKADEALQLGLVSRVVPAADLAAEVTELATTMANGPTLAYASVKAAVNYGASHSLEESLGLESQLMSRTGSSADHRGAVEAFVEKREPSYQGR